MTSVVNIKLGDKYDVYVGRPSPFGNPYSHEYGGLAQIKVATREMAVSKYREWLLSQPDLIAKVKAELKNKVLGCWCVPLACHANVLAEIADS